MVMRGTAVGSLDWNVGSGELGERTQSGAWSLGRERRDNPPHETAETAILAAPRLGGARCH